MVVEIQMITDFLPQIMLGGFLGALIAVSLTFVIMLLIGVYVYFSLAWFTIGKKLKYKYSWLAWIPFARTAMILQMGKQPWQLVFLYLIPILGWIIIFVYDIIAKWYIFEKRNYPNWFALSSLFMLIPKSGFILYAVVLGFVAWGDRKKMLKI